MNCPPSDSLLIRSFSIVTAPLNSVTGGFKPSIAMDPLLLSTLAVNSNDRQSSSGTLRSSVNDASPDTLIRSRLPPKTSPIGLLALKSRMVSRVPVEYAPIVRTGRRKSAISTTASTTALPRFIERLLSVNSRTFSSSTSISLISAAGNSGRYCKRVLSKVAWMSIFPSPLSNGKLSSAP